MANYQRIYQDLIALFSFIYILLSLYGVFYSQKSNFVLSCDKKMASKSKKNKDIKNDDPDEMNDSGNALANKNTQKLRMYLAVSAGFKKQLTKTSQLLSEKVGGNKGSELEECIIELGNKIDIVNDCIEDIQDNTKTFLQPQRKKLSAHVQASYQKARGQGKNLKNPIPEANLSEAFLKGGNDLGDDTPYSSALVELGTTFQYLSDLKENMESDVKQVFLEPLNELLTKDLKEISHHRKKMKGRRLEYDYVKGKGGRASADELQVAEDKFNESKELCYNGMMNFLDNDTEHISQLHAFSVAILDYHKSCTDRLDTLVVVLHAKMKEASGRAREKRPSIVPKYNDDTTSITSNSSKSDGRRSSETTPPMAKKPPRPKKRTPCARAIFDFEAENDGDLEFKIDDIIDLKAEVDDNWLEGECHGKSGVFPRNFVEVVIPLP